LKVDHDDPFLDLFVNCFGCRLKRGKKNLKSKSESSPIKIEEKTFGRVSTYEAFAEYFRVRAVKGGRKRDEGKVETGSRREGKSTSECVLTQMLKNRN
jgi:hypothetical protein